MLQGKMYEQEDDQSGEIIEKSSKERFSAPGERISLGKVGGKQE